MASSDFAQALTQRVNAYFEDRGLSKHANGTMIFKTVLGFSLWISTYAVIMADWLSPTGFLALYIFHGFVHLFMCYIIAHDANHGSYSSNQRVNMVMSRVFDLVGASSYMWRLLHNVSHHSFVNVTGKDSAITSHKFLRFSPDEKWYPMHRYQHIYAPLVYCLATLEWVLAKDFYYLFFQKDYGNRRIDKHPRKELIFILAIKAFYFIYILVLPIMFLSVPWYIVVLGFLIFHACIGFHIALIFQTTHIIDGTVYPQPDEDGYITNDLIKHILSTTADYSRQKPITTWMLGCLNLHVIHHMYPGICHVHYPALTQIVMKTAEEFGYRYREHETVVKAFRAHLKMLKSLGQKEIYPFERTQITRVKYQT